MEIGAPVSIAMVAVRLHYSRKTDWVEMGVFRMIPTDVTNIEIGHIVGYSPFSRDWWFSELRRLRISEF